MQQGPSKEIKHERLLQIAKFYGKSKDDPTLLKLIEAYYKRLDETPDPMPERFKAPTKYIQEWMEEMEIDPIILEDKWWTNNTLLVAYSSRFGWTKNEWKKLTEYITNG